MRRRSLTEQLKMALSRLTLKVTLSPGALLVTQSNSCVKPRRRRTKRSIKKTNEISKLSGGS